MPAQQLERISILRTWVEIGVEPPVCSPWKISPSHNLCPFGGALVCRDGNGFSRHYYEGDVESPSLSTGHEGNLGATG